MTITTKLVIRLMTADGHMLGWCENRARATDGCLRANGPITMAIRENGDAAYVSIHWTDLNVVVDVQIPQTHVRGGDTASLFEDNAVMLQAGGVPTKRLPPVTVGGAVEIGIPVHNMGVRG